VDSNEGASIEERVTVRYVPLSEPLWIGGPHEQIVAPLSVSRARGGTVFHVTPDQWEALAAFAAEIPRNTSDLEHLRKTPTGQGFGLSAAQRKAVEDHAMALALAHYGTLWVAVDDVHRHERKCRRGAVEHHVEVKGTTGPGNAVLLSKNEVQHAQDFFPNVSLFVVSEIQLDEDDEGFPIATGGHIRIIEPWRVTDCTLVAMTYQCFLPMFSPGSAERSFRTEEGQT